MKIDCVEDVVDEVAGVESIMVGKFQIGSMFRGSLLMKIEGVDGDEILMLKKKEYVILLMMRSQ